MKIETIPLIGIVTLLVALLNLLILFRNARKSAFVGAVTSSRIKYIQDIRESISQFCGLAHAYNKGRTNAKPEDLINIPKEADALRHLIRLYLNPEDKYWDTKIMEFCEEVIRNTDKSINELDHSIEKLVVITQYLLKLEWQGIKEEAESGILSKKQKKKLYDSYVALYEKHIAENKKLNKTAEPTTTAGAAHL